MSASDDLKWVDGAEGRVHSGWGQAYPRCLRLASDALLVPFGTLRVLLRKSGRLEVFYTGFALAPWIGNLDSVILDATRSPRPGDLVLCEADGWGDIRRILARGEEGSWITGLDPLPSAREALPPNRVIAVVSAQRGSGGALGRAIASAFPIWSRIAAVLYWIRMTFEAPHFGDRAAASVQLKYEAQVEEYVRLVRFPLVAELRGLLERLFPKGGSVLVAGAGAGGEAIHLARAGYRVTGFDVLDEMVRAARKNAAAAGVDIEFVQADMAALDLPGRTFDGIYVTPLVYSFVPGRERRVRSIQRMGRHLASGAPLVYSAHVIKSLPQFLQAALTWARNRPGHSDVEFGDWFTWFLRPDGNIGKSFTHLFSASAVLVEAREAGFRSCRREGGYFIARGFGTERQATDR
jgi:SAM-dependent methyltransferase